MRYQYFYFYSTIGILKYVQTIGLAIMDAHMNILVKMGQFGILPITTATGHQMLIAMTQILIPTLIQIQVLTAQIMRAFMLMKKIA